MKDKESDFFEKILSDVKKLKNDKKTKELKTGTKFQDQSQTKDDSLRFVSKKCTMILKYHVMGISFLNHTRNALL